jgi:hypothetical protein
MSCLYKTSHPQLANHPPDELENLESLDEYYGDFGDSTLQEEIVAVVQARLDKALKELEEM